MSATVLWSTALLDIEGVGQATVPAGATIADALDLAQALASDELDIALPVLVKVVLRDAEGALSGLFYARDEWALTVVPDGAVVVVMTMPLGKKTSRIAAMLAVVVAATLLGGPLGAEAAAMMGVTSEAGIAAVTTIATIGINVVGNALVNAFLPPITGSNPARQEQPSPTYNLNAQGNYARLGQAVPECFGTTIHYPDLLCLYSEWHGETKFNFVGLDLGEGDFEIHEWGFDRTPAWRAEPWNILGRHHWTLLTLASVVDRTRAIGLSTWEITLNGGGTCLARTTNRAWTPGVTHTLSFIAWVEGTTAAQTLRADLYPDTLPETAFTVTSEPDVYTWSTSSSHANMSAASARFFATLASGVKIHITDIQWVERAYAPPYMERPANLTAGYTSSFPGAIAEFVAPGGAPGLFSDAVVPIADVSGQAMLGTNEAGFDWIGPYPLNAAGTSAIAGAVHLCLTRGAGRQEDDGSFSPVSVSFEIQVQQIDNAGLPIGSWSTVVSETVTDDRAGHQLWLTRRFQLANPRVQIRGRRTNASPDDNRVVDDLVWGGAQAYFAPSASTGSESWMMLRAAASEQLQGNLGKIYVIKTRKLPVPTTSGWTAARPTRSIAAAAARIYLACAPSGAIDRDGLASLDRTWTIRGDTFDGIFDNARSAWDVLQSIARTGRSRAILPGGVFAMVRDEPRTLRSVGFSTRNILPGSESIEYVVANEDLADGLTVEFLDERTWRTATVDCDLPGITATNRKRLSMPYIVRRDQAWREGMFQLGQNAYRRIFTSHESEMEGLLVWPGTAVLFGHDAVDWGQTAVVKEFDGTNTRRIIMDRALNWKTGETHKITLTQRNGRVWGPVTVTRESDTTALLPVSLPAGVVHPSTVCVSKVSAGGRIEPSTVQFGYSTYFPRNMVAIGAKPRAGGRSVVSLAIDDPRVHQVDQALPPAEISPPATPAAESVSLAYTAAVTGSGTTRTVTFTITSYGASIRMIEYNVAGRYIGLAPNPTSFAITVSADYLSPITMRGIGRWTDSGPISPT